MKRLLLPFLLLAATGASAHGDAAWIMADPAYVTGAGSHCCGPTDCQRAPAGAVVEEGPGVWLVPATGQRFRQGEKGVYPSREGGFWWCRRGARVVCFFYDGGES